MAKTKDLFLNIVANPNMTLEDLASVGLTSENTMLLDRAQYASNEKVQDMFRDSEGNFDESKFNTWYDLAEQSYNILANDEANLNLMNVTAYDSDNKFVDPSKRKRDNKPHIVKLPNPDRLNVSINRIGKVGPRILSQDEIAQTQQVLLNPTEVANGAEPVYGSSPNESWFEDFWDTRVMAAWDEDGTHTDPVTGKEVQHKKGDLKLNENGTYYYESLDGRSVYGKRVLNKFNTLTTDGSVWNKYDFFDSDSIEQKSIGGSVLKNLALVGSMFIPYVGWGVAAASVAHQMAGLTATFGKMLAGSDSPTLDAIEGWVKSTDRRNLKTEYAQQNTWCWENFIDLIGDTTAQLREQRAIFKFAPGIIKGDFKALNDKAMKEYGEKLLKESMENITDKSFQDIARIAMKQNPGDWKKQMQFLMQETKGVFSAKAEKQVRDYLNSYYKLGEPIAKAYMTAITVQDTFGEAIQAGATDTEATLLTLGYAAAEAALLSTDLGKWIMPELRTEKLRNKMIAKKLFELPQETREMSRQLTKLDGETKKAWAKRLFNVGKDIMHAEYSMMPKTLGSIAASGLGEGIEEVSEEALADFSKSCFNLVQQLQGDSVRMNAWNHNWDWSEAANRYGMSFAGGILGGGINAAASDYKANREILNMNSQQAMQQLVYMARNNELEDFWKTVNKTQLASTELSTQLNDNGIGYKPGTKEDNQDLAAKKALKKQIDLINSILNAENAKLDDNGLLSAIIKADPSLKDMDPVKEYRMRALSNSATAGRFLNEWNTVTSDIIKNRMEQAKIQSKYGDKSSEKMSDEDEQALKRLGEDLKVLQERKDMMLDGTRTREYVRDALFEMSHSINELFNNYVTEVRYAEAKTGKKYKDLSDNEKQELHTKYEQFKNSNQYAEKVHELADIYETMAITTSQGLQASADFYEQVRQNNYKNITELNNLVKTRLNLLNQIAKDPEQGISLIQQTLNDDYFSDASQFDATQELKNKINQIDAEQDALIAAVVNRRNGLDLTQDDHDEINAINNNRKYGINTAILDSVFDKVIATYDEFIKVGFIHPETRNMLKQMTDSLTKQAGSLFETYEYIDDDLSDAYLAKETALQQKVQELDNLTNTPLIENLKQFQLSTNTDKTALDLINYLIDREIKEKKDINNFQLDSATIEQFKDARNLLLMYRTAIVGARYDNVDLDNIVGFNTTLNEISGANETPKLAEIDAQTADLALEDINKVLKRLDYAESLHKLNTGNKYNVQNKTAINKQYVIYNKLKSFISILEKDEYADWRQSPSWIELNEAISNSGTLSSNSGFGSNYEARNFTITPEDKAKIEKESIQIQEKLHKFLNENVDGSDASIEKLSKLLTYNNFKGLLNENNEFFDQNSVDMDDSAFVWWLCATAALSPDQFYNNYRTILGEEREGEKPIAPIPTQELGVFTLTAAITNGDMFRTFGKAMRNSLNGFWSGLNETEREQIVNETGIKYLLTTKDSKFFKNNDFLPNFDNIVFVEGIAGSGKSTGVLKTLSRLLAKTNPDFISQKVLFAHTSQPKAQKLAESTEFSNFEAHDHDSLLKYMSADYVPQTPDEEGVYKYKLGEDVKLVDGLLRANWNVAEYNPDDVAKTIIIDEWSHYNQLEQDLIQRFAQKYGVTVLTMGDYDQLTPESKIIDSSTGEDKDNIGITPSRNMTPRVAKLGVSMRTDNEVKNSNMYKMLAWRKNPTDQFVDLHYYQDENGIFGDKVHNIDGSYGDKLVTVKADVKKMIDTLKPDEKIGYIYDSQNSELYKWITETEGTKEHIIPYTETDAHGQEAQYYIVENYSKTDKDALQFFNSLYTGITRSEQGSLVITSSNAVMKSGKTDKFNQAGLKFEAVQDTEMLPNTYTDAGTRDFTNKRKQVLNDIFQDREVEAFTIKPRTAEEVIINNEPDTDEDPSLNQPPVTQQQQQSTQQQTQTTQQQTTQQSQGQSTQSQNPPTPQPQPTPDQTNQGENTPPPLTAEDAPPLEEEILTEVIDPERTSEPEGTQENWKGPLPKNQKLFNKFGKLVGQIVGETDDSYIIKTFLSNGSEAETVETKDNVDRKYYLDIPKQAPRFKVGDKFIYKVHTPHEIKRIELISGNGEVEWLYVTQFADISESEFIKLFNDGDITHYTTEEESETPPTTAYETEGQAEYQEALDEQFGEETPVSVSEGENPNDINLKILGFTFNNQYLLDDKDFDKQGNVTYQITYDQNGLPIYPDDRIDNGYGLYKLNPNNFKSRINIQDAIGQLRQHLQFGSNQDIANQVQQLTGLSNLKVRWAFISKSGVDYQGPYSRYNAPNTTLEYMNKEDHYVPSKLLSAVVYDSRNKPILELPVVTFQSPHSILKQLDKLGLAQDVVNIWKKKTKPEDTYYYLNDILDHIRNNRKGLPGYQSLGDVIELWLFTSNGIKFLPKDRSSGKSWNLYEQASNLGNLYITERVADDVPEFNFEGKWEEIEKLQRKDRFISSIMMNKTDVFTDTQSRKTFSIFKPYTPYVFISDSPKITNDEQAAKRYLQQQADPTLEKIVKAVPVVPPEVTVSQYLYGMSEVLKGSRTQPYGNAFTPYRIWTAILKAPDSVKNAIMAPLDQKDRQEVMQLMSDLTALEQGVQLQPNWSKLKLKKERAMVMNDYNENTNAFAKLRKHLVNTCYYDPFGDVPTGNQPIIDAIQQACDSAKITGVLCKPHFESSKTDQQAIGKFAYKVKTDQQFRYPGHGSYRIFGKIDTPTYDLSSLLPTLRNWASKVRRGFETTDPDTGEKIYHPDIWYYEDYKFNDAYYLNNPIQSNINLDNVLPQCKELLAKLGMEEYNIDVEQLLKAKSDNAAVKEAIRLINREFIKTPGNFVISINGQFKYGNIDPEQNSELQGYQFKQQLNDRGHIYLEFYKNDSIKQIEVQLDLANNKFSVELSKQQTNISSENTEQFVQNLQEVRENPIIKDNLLVKQVIDKINSYIDLENNVVDIEGIQQALATSGLDPFTLASLEITLQLDQLNNQQETDCIVPTKLSFK